MKPYHRTALVALALAPFCLPEASASTSIITTSEAFATSA